MSPEDIGDGIPTVALFCIDFAGDILRGRIDRVQGKPGDRCFRQRMRCCSVGRRQSVHAALAQIVLHAFGNQPGFCEDHKHCNRQDHGVICRWVPADP